MQVNGKPQSTNVYVVAENRLLRETLVRMFRKRADLCVVGSSGVSGSLAEQVAFAQANVVLSDCLMHLPQANLVGDLLLAIPEMRIVLFAMEDDESIFLRAVRLGVHGYILKSASSAELVDAIRAVAQDDVSCPEKFHRVLFKAVASDFQQKPMIACQQKALAMELTPRQRHLMSLVATGMSNKEIASSLNLSEFTVKNHLYRIMKQLDAQTRHHAVDLIRASETRESEWPA
jgi:DNA-binding NarL/FixJ family response regulator